MDNGFAIYTYDCEGHGLSQSHANRGFIQNAWSLVADLVQFTSFVRRERPGLPVFAMGESMGGGICVGAAVRNPTLFDRLILAAPMLSIERAADAGANRMLIPIAPYVFKF